MSGPAAAPASPVASTSITPSASSSPHSKATNENEKTTSSSSKERLTSPAPLGVSDSNVSLPVATMSTATAGTKAVKRTATSGLSNAEKRKKALKRL